MKGPFERLKYDLRRIWECPACGHKVRTDGTVTTQVCRCGKNNTNPAITMKLVGDGPRRLVPPVPRPVVELVETPQVAATPPAEVATATQVEVVAVVEEKVIEVTTTEAPPTTEVLPTQEAAGPDA